MPRDLKSSRRNSGKDDNVEEIENVPINPNNLASDSSAPNPKPSVEQLGSAKRKCEWTPVKARAKISDTSTPERQGTGNLGRKRLALSNAHEYDQGHMGQSEMGYYLGQPTRNGGSVYMTPRVGGTAGKGYAQNTPARSFGKPPNPGFAPLSSLRHPGSARAGSYSALSRRFSGSSAQLCTTTVNTVEVPHFDLKEDPSFWMDHNVQVIIRVRPLNSFEINTQGYNRCVKQENAQSITWIGQPETRFTFDHVACETVDQEMLFRMSGLPMVENCLSGYNSCMFAYGQTGSGKTYTMLGEMEDLEFKPSSHRGMTPRIFEFLFARISAEEESRRDEKLKYSCKCSFLEIYNEQITDLLDPTSTNLLLREDIKKGVYVENLTEFEVHSVSDVLRLLIQGSSNRKVAATDMNRESSRSHTVFTCVVESKWERDSTSNLRFARLNLVDLAGSERQKLSGAEGERLKEAANINKSLSTLGHVIMLLVDIAQGKPKHIPYRDSRLSFLLQDSLGGNSKTMIIANISPSICCAGETLNTLKFAQRAKLIRNNAVVNEDSSGDIAALQHQIWLLREELSALKRQKVSRRLAFDPSSTAGDLGDIDSEVRDQNDVLKGDKLMMLSGALRREEIAETTIKELRAEIEQLKLLVHQREEDTKCTKMMLKFREDKIKRMESLLGDLKPVDAYLLEENAALSEEVQLLRDKVDKNPEVTRFASENIRLQEQLRMFQNFYEEGERDILMNELSELRSQLLHFFDGNKHQVDLIVDQVSTHNVEGIETDHSELADTRKELAECRSKLKSCLERNTKLSREIEDLHALMRNKELDTRDHNGIVQAVKDIDAPCVVDQLHVTENCRSNHRMATHAEEILNLELELDILKIMLKEERLSRGKMEEVVSSSVRDAEIAEERVLLVTQQYDDAKRDLKEAKSVIEALESQQLLSISEIEELKDCNDHYLELLREREQEISTLKEPTVRPRYSRFRPSELKESPLQVQLKRMQASLDKAKSLNMWYQNDHAAQRSNEEEMDKIRQQAEAETADVIVSLQEELSMLQHRVQESDMKEREAENKFLILESNLKELQETLDTVSQDKKILQQNLLEKDLGINSLKEDWEILRSEIEGTLLEGNETLQSVCDEVDSFSWPGSDKRVWLSEQMGRMMRHISEKESIIQELTQCLEDANVRVNDLEGMLLSLRGAAVVLSESHEQDCREKEEEISQVRSELGRKTNTVAELEQRLRLGHDQMTRASTCATAAFVVVSRLSESNAGHLDALRVMHIQLKELQEMNQKKDGSLREKSAAFEEAQRKIESLGGKAGEITEAVGSQVLSLQAAFSEFETKCERKMLILNHKLHRVEECSQEVKCSWSRTKELHNFELLEAKTITDQETAKFSGPLAEFGCTQDKMKAADVMNNELMIANETMNLQIENLKKTNVMLTAERDSLITEVREWQSCYKLKDENCKNLEELVERDASNITSLVEDLTRSVSETQGTYKEAMTSVVHDVNLLKSQIQDAVKWMHLSLEKISSEILAKDCAISVLYLCHMGILVDAVSGLQSENSLLHAGICKSDAVIYLKKHNIKLIEKLQMCQIINDKLLADIGNNFVCISSNESEARELSMKFSGFEEKLEILQRQEEVMLERSNVMSSELAVLTEKLDQSNSTVMLSLSEQERLLKSNKEEMKSQVENFMLDLIAKDFQVLILVSELQQLTHRRANMERERKVCSLASDYLITEVVNMTIVADFREQLLSERDTEVICLEIEAEEAKRREVKVLNQLPILEEEYRTLKEQMSMKENENESFKKKLEEMENSNFNLLKDIREKDLESNSFIGCIDTLKLENCRLEEDISTCGSRISLLIKDLSIKETELDDMSKALCQRSQDLENCAVKVNALQQENLVLRDELLCLQQSYSEPHRTSTSKVVKCIDSVVAADVLSCRLLEQLDKNIKMILDKISQDACQNLDVVSGFLEELEFIDSYAKGLVSENFSLRENAANSMTHEDEMGQLTATLKAYEDALAVKSSQLEEALAYGQELGEKLKEQTDIITMLEMDLEKFNQSLKVLSDENKGLRSHIEDITAASASIERELTEKKNAVDCLENEIMEMGSTLGKMNDLNESLKSKLIEVSGEKDHLQKEVMVLEEKLETARALAQETEAIATECQDIAESRRIYAEDKEEEVKLLERSVEELGSTITALENKIDILRKEDERQQTKRKALESELHSLKFQMHTIESADADAKRHLDEKAQVLQQALKHIKIVEGDLLNKDREIAQCKTEITGLAAHAEGQASRLRRAESFLLRVMEELVQYRASSGTNSSITLDEVQRLNKKLKGQGNEKEKVQLVEMLLSLYSKFPKAEPLN